MMNLIKLLVPFMGLVAASNSTNATTSTAAPTTAAPTTAAANTTAAPKNTTKAAVVAKAANATKTVTIDIPTVVTFTGVDKDDFAKKSQALIASISVGGSRRMAASNITSDQVKKLLTITAKSFSDALPAAGKANRKVTIKSVKADPKGIEITFRVTLSGAAATAADADAIKAKVTGDAFKDAFEKDLKADVAADNDVKAFTPKVEAIKEPVVTLPAGVTPAKAKTTTAASGAVSFVAPVGAMLAAAFALF